MPYDRPSDDIEVLLLDLHLNQLPDAEAERVEEALAASAELAHKSEALRRMLRLLDASQVPDAPDDLADRVLARIDEQTIKLPSAASASALPAGSGGDLSGSPVLSLRELVAIAACITLFVGIGVPGYFKAQNFARRNVCQRQLASVWQASDAYAEANNGYYAHAGFVPGGYCVPTRAPNLPRYSNTAPAFQLLRGGYIPANNARVFVCPASVQGRPMRADDYTPFDDFAEPANVTYSFLFMNLPEGRRKGEIHVRMVIVADRNPLFDQRAAGHNLSPYERTNSIVHEDGAGQNVMYVDGAGGWTTEPTVGVNRDDIYRAGLRARYQGIERPTSPTDTWLIP